MSNDSIRELERDSIRDFVRSCEDVFRLVDVLDFGCGKQPYRSIVEGVGGHYTGFDRVEFPANVSEEQVGDDAVLREPFDVVLCTQVLQYVPHPLDVLIDFHGLLKKRNGSLVLTYATCWAIVEPEDLHRHTPNGIDRLLRSAGFVVERNEVRAEIDVGGFKFALGGGALARVR